MVQHQAPKHTSQDRPMKVYIRMRGLNQFELQEELTRNYSIYNIASKSWKVENGKSCVQTTNTGEALPRKNGKTHFTFDRVFDENTTTRDIYDQSCKDLVRDFVHGVSGSVILYGQTGTGKTFTMQGTGRLGDGVAGKEGIIHMAVQDLFGEISKESDSSFLLRMSVIEIYNEEVRDLLSDRQQSKVSTRYDSNTGLFVETNELFVKNEEGIMEALSIVDENRVHKETDMSKYSSRSHVVFRFTLEKMTGCDGLKSQNLINNEQSVQVSTLSLIDLAGSDASRLNSQKGNDFKKEGSNINKSLLALSHVFTDLGRSRKGFINYRDSNLTKILQRDLMSNCNISIICCITPSGLCTEQTRKTLEFGKCAFGVKFRPEPKGRAFNGSIVMKTLSEQDRLKCSAYVSDFKIKEIQARLNDIEKAIFNYSDNKKEVDITTNRNESASDIQSVDDDISLISQLQDTTLLNNHVEVSDNDSFSKAEQKFSEMEVQWSAMKCNVVIDDACCDVVPMEIQFHEGSSETHEERMEGFEDSEAKCRNEAKIDGEPIIDYISSEEIGKYNDIRCDISQELNDDCGMLLSYSMDSFSVSSDGTNQSKRQEHGCDSPAQSSSITPLSSSSPTMTDVEKISLDRSIGRANSDQQMLELDIEHRPSHEESRGKLECDVSSEDSNNRRHNVDEEERRKIDGYCFDSFSISSDGATQSKKENENTHVNQDMMQDMKPTPVASPDSSIERASSGQQMPELDIEHKPSHEESKSMIECDVSSKDSNNHGHYANEKCHQISDVATPSKKENENPASKKENENNGVNQDMQDMKPMHTTSSPPTDIEELSLDRSIGRASMDEQMPEPVIEHKPSKDENEHFMDRFQSPMRSNDKLDSFDLQGCDEEQSFVSELMNSTEDYDLTDKGHVSMAETSGVKGKDITETNLNETGHGRSEQFVDREQMRDVTSLCGNGNSLITYHFAAGNDAVKSNFNYHGSIDQRQPPTLVTKLGENVGTAMEIHSNGIDSIEMIQDNDESCHSQSVDVVDDLTLCVSYNSEAVSTEYFVTEYYGNVQNDPNSLATYLSTSEPRDFSHNQNSPMFKMDEKVAAVVFSSQDGTISQNIEPGESQTDKKAVEGNEEEVLVEIVKLRAKIEMKHENNTGERHATDDHKMNEATIYDELDTENENDAGGNKENFLDISHTGTRQNEASTKPSVLLASNGSRQSSLINKERRDIVNDVIERSPIKIMEHSGETRNNESLSDGPIKMILMNNNSKVSREVEEKSRFIVASALQTEINYSVLQNGEVSHNIYLGSMFTEVLRSTSHQNVSGKQLLAETKMKDVCCQEEELSNDDMNDIHPNTVADKNMFFSPKKIASIKEGEAYLQTWELMSQSYRQHCNISGKILV
mmetsp:Transcript_8244/g.15526  ORF Transcript_8244/g.15526 Transcript_8244/m.15526 type:complete len:1385 (+) Transcript_8244:75-4229(+)